MVPARSPLFFLGFFGAGIKRKGICPSEAFKILKKLVEAQGASLGDADGAAAQRDLTCPECGKAFLSDKAMYGHLRAHPQRGYKGATRPAATADDDAFVVAGVKRPRKVGPRKEAELDDDHPGRSPAAAMILLDMATGRRRPLEQPTQPAHVAGALSTPASHQMPSVEQDADAVAVHHAPGIQQLSVPDHFAGDDWGQKTWEAEKPAELERVFGNVKDCLALQEAEKDVLKEHVAAVTAEPPTPEMKAPVKLGPPVAETFFGDKNGPVGMLVSSAGTKTPVKRRLQDVEQPPPGPPPTAEAAAGVKPPPVRRIPSPASNRKYECSICHKTFPSHQALGGHMASHKRHHRNCSEQLQHDPLAAAQVPHNILAYQRHGVVDAPVVAGGSRLGEEGLVNPPAPAPRPQHQCIRCHQIFPTGQALGGHMRKHFTPPEMDNAAPVPPIAGAIPAPPVAGATPAPPVASATPPPMANGSTPETPIGRATPGPPIGSATAPEQPSRRLFDLNELPRDEGENHQP
ncbi:hypothetical protein E2562_002853 [Oryza meyeriana var. granulata]|uniref:C2H2-type domain-containing protein n=1 Tax=Oryza meyeriana var. granulata TaxID=110450 RepID=A0A6G1BRL0_9ORYZ|nr:hypothetical protein E2562_002853 [Oryza meyeriana var. granulata]